jgi:hypothetical protein
VGLEGMEEVALGAMEREATVAVGWGVMAGLVV